MKNEKEMREGMKYDITKHVRMITYTNWSGY